MCKSDVLRSSHTIPSLPIYLMIPFYKFSIIGKACYRLISIIICYCSSNPCIIMIQSGKNLHFHEIHGCNRRIVDQCIKCSLIVRLLIFKHFPDIICLSYDKFCFLQNPFAFPFMNRMIGICLKRLRPPFLDYPGISR